VQTIGFSFSPPQELQYHISRFGQIALVTNNKLSFRITVKKDNCTCLEPVTSEWLVLDMSSRGGDSGAPVFLMDPQKKLDYAKVIGFVQRAFLIVSVGKGTFVFDALIVESE